MCAETFVGLLQAALGRGAASSDVLDILDAAWLRIETALSDTALVLVLEAFAKPLAADCRWPPRLVHFLTDERGSPLCAAVMAWCGTVLEQGGRLTDHDTSRIAASLCLTDQAQWLPRLVFQYLWDWAIERQRADVVRSLLSLNLSPEAVAFRQSLLEGLMARILSVRPSRWQKVAEALETLETLQQTPGPNEECLRALANRADRCPIHAAAYVAWLEDRCARPQEPMAWRANLFRVYVRMGLTRKANEMAKVCRGLKAVLQRDPRRYLAAHPRAEVSWGSSAWDDALVSNFRKFLQEVEVA